MSDERSENLLNCNLSEILMNRNLKFDTAITLET